MVQRTRGQNVFALGALIFSLPGLFFFGLIGGAIVCLICVCAADRLAAKSAAALEREGYLASAFAGCCIAWLALLAGMVTIALAGLLAWPHTRDLEWFYAHRLIGPFANPVGAFLGVAFGSLPTMLLGLILGVFVRKKVKRQ